MTLGQPGIPHSIQAHEFGVEFLLVFDQGDFTEEGTNLVTQTFAKNPSTVNAKNLRVDVSVLDTIPQDQLFIFNGSPFPHNISNPTQNITGPAGPIPRAVRAALLLSAFLALRVDLGLTSEDLTGYLLISRKQAETIRSSRWQYKGE